MVLQQSDKNILHQVLVDNNTANRVIAALEATASGGVSSVFGRSGIVVAVSGDYAVGQVTGAAPLASPTFTGVPAVPTAAPGTNTTQAASTAFVTAAIAAFTPTGVLKADGTVDSTGQQTFGAGIKTDGITDNGNNLNITQATTGKNILISTADAALIIQSGAGVTINATGANTLDLQSAENIHLDVASGPGKILLGDTNSFYDHATQSITIRNDMIVDQGVYKCQTKVGGSDTLANAITNGWIITGGILSPP